MKKTFVLDTNVLLQSPEALFSFGDNMVVLTEAVLEELDNFKKGNTELNANARQVARNLDVLRNKGSLTDGVLMDNGGMLRVELNHRDVELPTNWEISKSDNRILQVCKALQKQGHSVTLVTKDILERIKADIVGVTSNDFTKEQAPICDDQYQGRISLYVDKEIIDKFYQDKKIIVKDNVFNIYRDNNLYNFNHNDFFENMFIFLMSFENEKHTALGKYVNGEIVVLQYDNSSPWDIIPRNSGQRFLIEALLDDDIPLVIAKGSAGTAKTFLSLACGLEKVMEEKKYRKILICRPTVTMDEDLGYLPGTEQDKIAPYMRSIYDNLEVLMDSDESSRYKYEDELQDRIQELFDRKYIDTQAVGFLRGRSISNTLVILDESQNLSIKQAKAIVSRAGQNTKIVFLGDIFQIDSPYLDQRTNGLSYVTELMKGHKLCAVVNLYDSECVRSQLAKAVVERLNNE